MCKCTPNNRTPYCGKFGCKWPKPENTRPTAPQNAALGVDRQSVDQETVTNEMIAAALEESLAVMKEYNVDALSPFADYPPPSVVVKRAITAALKVRPTAPQNAEALAGFDKLIQWADHNANGVIIGGEIQRVFLRHDIIKTIRQALQSPARPVVKPLVWVDYEDDGMKMCVLSIAKCIFGQYQIRRDSQGRLWPEGTKMLNETFRNTIDEAKAAAEAHYQAKIGECLNYDADQTALSGHMGRSAAEAINDSRQRLNEGSTPSCVTKIDGLREEVEKLKREPPPWTGHALTSQETSILNEQARYANIANEVIDSVLKIIDRAQLAAQEGGCLAESAKPETLHKPASDKQALHKIDGLREAVEIVLAGYDFDEVKEAAPEYAEAMDKVLKAAIAKAKGGAR